MLMLMLIAFLVACSSKIPPEEINPQEMRQTQQTISVTSALLSYYALNNGGRYPSAVRGLKAIPGVQASSYFDAWEQPLLYLVPALNCDAPFELISGGFDRRLDGRGDISSCN